MAPGLLAYGAEGWGDELLAGLWLTVVLALCSFAAGVALGTLQGLAELRGGPLARLASAYAAVMRSLPELLVILFVFFALGPLLEAGLGLLGLPVRVALGAFPAGVIALALVIAAYAAEVVKGAVRALPAGMDEAAAALGLPRLVRLRLVLLPLAARFAFPGLANLWMVTIKTTPFVSAIQIEEFIRAAGTAGQNTRQYFLFYGVAIAGYLVLSGLSMLAQSRFEARLFRHVPRVLAP